MRYGWDVEVATIVLWNFFALIVNIVAFVIIYMKASKNKSLNAFFIVQFSMMIWLIGKILKTVSPTVELRWFFIVFYYFGICLLEVSFLDFSYIYYKRKTMNKKIRIAIYLVGVIQFIIIVTNPLHHKFYSVYDFWGDDFAIAFYAHMAVNYLFILIGMIFCSIKFKKQISDKSKLEKNLIMIAILVPIGVNFLYITRTLQTLFIYLGVQIFDITPLIYTWSLLVFVYATFKYEFFELTPIMQHEVAKELDNPLLILNKKLETLYTNSKFKKVFKDTKKISNKLILNKDTNGDSIFYYNNCYYTYCINKYNGIDGEKLIIFFTDVTSYELAKIALAEENEVLGISNAKLENQIDLLKQTSHVGAKNYIARELHDILGYSLVVTIKLLEVSKMFYKENKDKAYNSLEKANRAIKEGLENMKNITNKNSDMVYTTNMLEKEIKSMLKIIDVSGIRTNYFMRGKKTVVDEKTYDTIKKIITEIVTNILKHANATKMLLSIDVTSEQIKIQVMDNGKGAKNIVKGNGLNGIDGRLSLVGGKARYTSENKEGFVVNIRIPLFH